MTPVALPKPMTYIKYSFYECHCNILQCAREIAHHQNAFPNFYYLSNLVDGITPNFHVIHFNQREYV